MRRTFSLGIAALLLLGCEVKPPQEAEFALPDKPAGPGQGGSGGAPNNAPPGTGPIDLKTMKPQMTQDEVREGEHTVISGRVEPGTCTGKIRIDAIAPRGQAGKGKSKSKSKSKSKGKGKSNGDAKTSPRGPITAIYLETAGPFDGVIPNGGPYILAALCDQDNDGKIQIPTEPISPPIELKTTDGPITDLVLDLGNHMGADVGRNQEEGKHGPGNENGAGGPKGPRGPGSPPPPPNAAEPVEGEGGEEASGTGR